MEFYTKVFFVVLAALVAYCLLLVLQPFAGSLAWATFLAFILHPAHLWLTRRIKGRDGWSAGILTGLTPFVLLTPITFLGVVFAQQARALVGYIQQSDIRLDGSLLLRLEGYPVIGPVARAAREQLLVDSVDLQRWLSDAAHSILQHIGSIGSGIVISALGTLVGFFFMLFLLFFMLRDGTAIFSRMKRLIPVPEEHREQLFHHLASVTRGVFYGIGLTAIVQGFLVGIGFAIAGLPSPVVFGVLAAILALLPAGGAAIVWIPAVLYLAGAGRWGMAIFLLDLGRLRFDVGQYPAARPGLALRACFGVHGIRRRGGRHRRLRRHRHPGRAGVPGAGGGDSRVFRRGSDRAEQDAAGREGGLRKGVRPHFRGRGSGTIFRDEKWSQTPYYSPPQWTSPRFSIR